MKLCAKGVGVSLSRENWTYFLSLISFLYVIAITVIWHEYMFFNTLVDIFVLFRASFFRKQLFTHDMNLILAERQHSFAWLAVLLSSHTPTDMHLICHQHPKSYLNTAKNLWVNVPRWHTSAAQKPAILQKDPLSTFFYGGRLECKIKRINDVKMSWHIKTCRPWYIITIW